MPIAIRRNPIAVPDSLGFEAISKLKKTINVIQTTPNALEKNLSIVTSFQVSGEIIDDL
jgi:hypothetical protein